MPSGSARIACRIAVSARVGVAYAGEIAEASESVMQGMMGFKGRR